MAHVGQEYERVWVKDGDLSHVNNVKWAASNGVPVSHVWSETDLDIIAQVLFDTPYVDVRVERGLGDVLATKVRSLMLKAAAKDEGNHVVLSHRELEYLLKLPGPDIREHLSALIHDSP